MTSEEAKSRIKHLIASGRAGANDGGNRATRGAGGEAMRITGNNNIIAGRDVVHHHAPVEQRTVVQYNPGEEHITPSQRQRLRELVAEVHRTEAAIKRRGRGYGAIWGAFQKRFRIPKYELLPIERFEEAESYFLQTLGRLRSMRSAPKRDQHWRNSRYAAIHARLRQRGLEDWFEEYMRPRYGSASLSRLTNEELDAVYRAVIGKK